MAGLHALAALFVAPKLLAETAARPFFLVFLPRIFSFLPSPIPLSHFAQSLFGFGGGGDATHEVRARRAACARLRRRARRGAPPLPPPSRSSSQSSIGPVSFMSSGAGVIGGTGSDGACAACVLRPLARAPAAVPPLRARAAAAARARRRCRRQQLVVPSPPPLTLSHAALFPPRAAEFWESERAWQKSELEKKFTVTVRAPAAARAA